LWQKFYDTDEVLTLGQLVERSGLSKTTCFRLLKSLVTGGMIERVGKGAYRSRVQPLANRYSNLASQRKARTPNSRAM
jgi:DNA-binding IclR family transcriptional regulator